jgi:hypothetical protein
LYVSFYLDLDLDPWSYLGQFGKGTDLVLYFCAYQFAGNLRVIKCSQLKSSQLLLSRFQIHVILCLIPTDGTTGLCDTELAIQICVTMIFKLFNPENFFARAERIRKEIEEANKRKELEEMASTNRKKKKTEEPAQVVAYIIRYLSVFCHSLSTCFLIEQQN